MVKKGHTAYRTVQPYQGWCMPKGCMVHDAWCLAHSVICQQCMQHGTLCAEQGTVPHDLRCVVLLGARRCQTGAAGQACIASSTECLALPVPASSSSVTCELATGGGWHSLCALALP
jgi:hypothetical protein